MSRIEVSNVSGKGDIVIEDKFQNLNIISEDWIVVDKSESNKSTVSHPVSNEDNNIQNELSVQNLKPYVPFPVEELAFTTRLDTWSNCNVRVIGMLQIINDAQYLESINEVGGSYKILLSFQHMDNLPLSNQAIQVFGEIKISQRNNDIVPFISVLFFRNIDIGDLPVYIKAIEYMRRHIPLFLKTEVNSNDLNDTYSDERKYYYYHQLNDNGDKNHETELYSNDDFNFAYNTDYLY